MKRFNLGIIGMSEGNGHPYSWSAIFNGYRAEIMAKCGFPVIPQYLAKHRFPDEAIADARVTHIWTQSPGLTEHIAQASYIERVVASPEEMIGEVDGILLARDDAANHLRFAQPFLEQGLPVYIDKPLALSSNDAHALFAMEKYPGQIFSCSALRFSNELLLSEEELNALGEIRHVQGRVPNSWDKYIVHAIDPILENIGPQGKIITSTRLVHQDQTLVSLCWASGITCSLQALGSSRTGIEIELFGTHGVEKRVFNDAFSAFKKALQCFVDDSLCRKITHKKRIIETVDVIEKGV